MKFTLTRHEAVPVQYLYLHKVEGMIAAAQPKLVAYQKAIQDYRHDRYGFVDAAAALGVKDKALDVLDKMQADPADADPRLFLQSHPRWPALRRNERYEILPVGSMASHATAFKHVGATPAMVTSVDDAYRTMSTSLRRLVEGHKAKPGEPVPPEAVPLGFTFEVVGEEDQEAQGLLISKWALLRTTCLAVNQRADEQEVYLRRIAVGDPDEPSTWRYAMVYPEDNAERQLYREIFLGKPRVSRALLPRLEVRLSNLPRHRTPSPVPSLDGCSVISQYGSRASSPEPIPSRPVSPPPALSPVRSPSANVASVAAPAPSPVAVNGELLGLIRAREMLVQAGADQETLDVLSEQITNLAIEMVELTQQS